MSYSPQLNRNSIGGDVMLRSKSQQLTPVERRTVQITSNYPEHLNPFYKDENHKRIRFLKVIPKKLHLTSSSSSSQKAEKPYKPRSERRSSFSVDGIKEIWKLRPFRSSNKKPMPTHVTKTSESPPPIRASLSARQRDEQAFQDVPFQRSSRVRASMSEVSSSGNGFGYRPEESFVRNNRYRSTMGGAPEAETRSPVYSMKPGTSQLSVRSTNPFDEDDDMDDMMSVSGYSVASMPNRPYRKKRRAPLPPKATTNKTDDDKASTNPRVILTSASTESGTTTQVEITNTEKTTVEIQNIASEIDAMIRRADSRQSIDNNEDITKDVYKDDDDSHPEKIQSVKIENETKEINNNNNITKEDDNETLNKVAVDERLVTNGQTTEIEPVTVENTITDENSSNKEILITNTETKSVSTIESPIEIVENEQETKSEVDEINNNKIDPIPVPLALRHSLLIVESEDEDTSDSKSPVKINPVITKIEEIDNRVVTKSLELIDQPKSVTRKAWPTDPYRNVVVEMEKYDVRYVSLKGEEGEEAEASSSNNNNNNSKTVKDIIDSINKSQSLLKINVDEQKRRASNGSINTRIRELERKESECNEMLSEIDLDRKIGGLYAVESSTSVYENNTNADEVDNIPVVIRELHLEEEEGENSLFKKCRPVSNHDWNPLPKPKRSHSSSPSATPK